MHESVICAHTHTHRQTHSPLRGWWLTEVNSRHGERELEEGGMEGGEEKARDSSVVCREWRSN